jgi:hypothetical protein
MGAAFDPESIAAGQKYVERTIKRKK